MSRRQRRRAATADPIEAPDPSAGASASTAVEASAEAAPRRRSGRSRRGPAKSGARSRWMIRLTIAALALGVVAMGGSYLWLRSWLHSESFRRMLAGQADAALQVSSEFGPFRWNGTRMNTESFLAHSEGLIKGADAEDLEVEIGLGGWWHGVWRIEDARARRIELEIDATAADRMKNQPAPMQADAPPPPATAKQGKWYDSLIPHEVELKQLQIGSSSVKVITAAGPVSISNTSWKVTPDGAKGSYRAEGTEGKVKLPWKWAPPMHLGKGRIRYQGESVYLTGADFQVYESGRLDLDGEMSVKGEGYIFNGKLRDVFCREVLPESWKQRLSGQLSSDFTMEATQGGPKVSGSLELEDGVLTALPVLDALSAYADTTRFRRIALQEGKTDYEWQDGTLTLRKLVLSSEGLVRLEGGIRIDPEEHLDGRFRLGIVPGILARIPGAETQVFSPGKNGLLWTDLHITGTFDHPEEDLSGRLVEAAGLRMIEILPETGEKVLKFTQDVLDKDLESHLLKGGQLLENGKAVIDSGKAVIDGGKEVIDSATDVGKGLIDGIFGGDKKKDE